MHDRRGGRARRTDAAPAVTRDRTEVGRKFRVGEYEGYIHVGLFEDGTPGDIFVDIAKEAALSESPSTRSASRRATERPMEP